MKPSHILELIALAALWGASFLFMRIGAAEFGPIALIELRVAIAAVVLIVILGVFGKLPALARNVGPMTFIGITNSALPFCLFAYATLTVTGGFAAILNATSPLWAAVVAFVWLRIRISAWRTFGLVLGFVGVVALVWGHVSLQGTGYGLAVVAGLAGSLSYGIAANYTRERAASVEPLVIATASQLAAAVCLLPLAIAYWPTAGVSARAWISVVLMGVASTALAYLLYFRLIRSVGPAKAITVTFLVPVFAVVWGYFLLGEVITLQMLASCLVILLGTAISTGLLGVPPGMRRAQPSSR
ncbi:MAG: DMT family transporter [Burkholderiaceae bacterium]|jgi:drug/metabolite transporter (DMT)-like permease